ncbi:MAG: hypothetical protein AAGG02_12785 [Cyanobacteria bacterium P01_H01_bin.15]
MTNDEVVHKGLKKVRSFFRARKPNGILDVFSLQHHYLIFLLGFIEWFLMLHTETDQSVLSVIYSLAVLIPSIAVGVRRCMTQTIVDGGLLSHLPISSLP